MSAAWVARSCVLVLAGALAGCTLGDTTVGSLGASSPDVPPASSPAAPAPVAMGPFLEGPVGMRLAETDREAAFKAQDEAVSTGERQTWRGSKGVYGYVEPAAVSGTAAAGGDGACRAFTHTIYFGGRPQVGHGTGCRNPDGSWRFTA